MFALSLVMMTGAFGLCSLGFSPRSKTSFFWQPQTYAATLNLHAIVSCMSSCPNSHGGPVVASVSFLPKKSKQNPKEGRPSKREKRATPFFLLFKGCFWAFVSAPSPYVPILAALNGEVPSPFLPVRLQSPLFELSSSPLYISAFFESWQSLSRVFRDSISFH